MIYMYSISLTPLNVDSIIQQISKAESLILSTHKQCDGDGLGAILALYHALKKSGKKVRCLTVDEVPKKYSYLEPAKHLEVFEGPHRPLEKTDLALIFDTNDHRLVEPLYAELQKKCGQILFIDHHPVLNHGPEPTLGSYIETRAASTGEIAYFIIKALGIRLDQRISESLYTSVAFDTQLFKFVKNSVNSHLIAADVLQYITNAQEIHRHLFATHTVEKVAFLAKVLGEIEYFGEKQIAVLRLSSQDLVDHNLDMDDSRDVIDMLMNIQSLQAAALLREDGPNLFKMSLRSKGSMEILGVAEKFGGGGHLFAAGAPIEGPYEEIKSKVVKHLLARLDEIDDVKKPSQK
ncbi:MAG TPA: hypothetical protein DCL41_01045 [Bdellovibrionales bacterium]|nr:hypothetical protein [Bdellovibrionales bacterium]